jgi:Skp family chaperone for outer membrane proteins
MKDQKEHQEDQQRTDQLSQVAEQRRAELIQPIMDRINVVIEAVRTEGQYHLILDLAAGSIIAADPMLDLTQQVIGRLAPAPEPGPGAP